MASERVAFGIEGIVAGILNHGEDFSRQAGSAAFAIFGLIVFFHLVEGTAELSKERPCRLVDGLFYLRLGIVFVLLLAYQSVFFGLAQQAIPNAMKGFNETWGQAWVNQQSALEELKTSSEENEVLKRSEVGAAKAAEQEDAAWYEKAIAWGVDALTTWAGYMSAGLLGVLLMAFLLMEGFWALGVATLTLAIGPICVVTLAHEKIEGVFWTFIKTFIVYVLLYLPLLHLACSFAGVIMADMTSMRLKLGINLGDGSDIVAHFVMVLVGPLLALSIVRSANGTITALAQSFGPGSGSAFAGAVGMTQNVGQMVAPAIIAAVMKGVGSGGGGGGGDQGARGGSEDAAPSGNGGPAPGSALRGES